jgi:hypothetical protein
MSFKANIKAVFNPGAGKGKSLEERLEIVESKLTWFIGMNTAIIIALVVKALLG